MRKKINQKLISNWSIWEICWVVVFSIIAVILTVIWKDTFFGFTVFFTGIICVVLVARGSIWNYAWGIYNVLGYAFIAYHNGYFGEVMLNAGFFLPAQIIGWVMWSKYLNDKEVKMKKFSFKWIILLLVGSAISIFIYGKILSMIKDQNVPYLDSMSTVLSVIAMILMMFRYAEQWLLWIIVDVVTIILWILRIDSGVDGVMPMIVMWSAYLVNAVYGYINWLKKGVL